MTLNAILRVNRWPRSNARMCPLANQKSNEQISIKIWFQYHIEMWQIISNEIDETCTIAHMKSRAAENPYGCVSKCYILP